jgi:hypothetical protein
VEFGQELVALPPFALNAVIVLPKHGFLVGQPMPGCQVGAYKIADTTKKTSPAAPAVHGTQVHGFSSNLAALPVGALEVLVLPAFDRLDHDVCHA